MSKKDKLTDSEDLSISDSTTLMPQEMNLPDKLCLLPLGGIPIFPGIFTPFMVNSNDDIKTIEEAYKGDGYVGFVLLKEDKKNPSAADLYKVGTAARIIKKTNLPDGAVNLFVSTIIRFRIKKVLSSGSPSLSRAPSVFLKFTILLPNHLPASSPTAPSAFSCSMAAVT